MANAMLQRGGSLYGSDDCTALASNVLEGMYAIVNDGTDQPQRGSLNLYHVLAEDGGHIETYRDEQHITPTETQQVFNTDRKYVETDLVVYPISPEYVGSNIPRRQSSDLEASGRTVTVPFGYYATAATKSISSGSASVAAKSIAQSTPSITVATNGLITAVVAAKSSSMRGTVSPGYISSIATGALSLTAATKTLQLSTITGATTTLTAFTTKAVFSKNKYIVGDCVVKVNVYDGSYTDS